MVTKRRQPSSPSTNSPSIISKALTAGSNFTKSEFEELPTVLFYLRQLVALWQGVLWGAWPCEDGLVGLVAFGVVNCFVIWFYVFKFLQVDDEDFELTSILQEGFSPALGAFLFSWILTYNMVHHS